MHSTDSAKAHSRENSRRKRDVLPVTISAHNSAARLAIVSQTGRACAVSSTNKRDGDIHTQ